MNDFMSLGIHRIWKKDSILCMKPSKGKQMIDVGCGTGDIAKLYLESTSKDETVFCIDPNEGMIEGGKKLKTFKKY